MDKRVEREQETMEKGVASALKWVLDNAPDSHEKQLATQYCEQLTARAEGVDIEKNMSPQDRKTANQFLIQQLRENSTESAPGHADVTAARKFLQKPSSQV